MRENTRLSVAHLVRDPVLLFLVILVFVGLFLFIILPLGKIFAYSVTNNDGRLSFQAAWDMLKSRSYLEPLKNSMLLGITTGILATIIGYVFAYALTRVDMPLKGFFKTIATIPIISPPFILSLSMIFLFGRNGLITRRLLGIEDANVYGMHSLVVVQTISFFPIAYLTLTGTLSKLNPAVEDAALNLGASRARIFRTVTLPLSVPGILSSFLLVFIQSMEDFSNPAVISGSFSTLPVEAYRTITGMYDERRFFDGAIAANTNSDRLSVAEILAIWQVFCDSDRQAHNIAATEQGSQAGMASLCIMHVDFACDSPILWNGSRRSFCQGLGYQF